MNLKTFSFIQHKLIPTALIAGNIALVQFLFLLAKGDYTYALWATVICITTLTIGIVRANKYLLMGGIGFYSIMLLGAI